MPETKQFKTPPTDGMIAILKSMRRGASVSLHYTGLYYLVTTSNSVWIKSRDAKGLIKRGLVEFDHDLMRMKWYRLSELGKTITI